MRFLFIILLIGCQSVKVTDPIPEPPEMDEIIMEVEASQELKKADPILTERIQRKLKESQNYNEMSYNKILELEDRLNKLEEENKSLREENESLKSELSTWRAIKAGFVITLVMLAGIGIMIVLIKSRKLLGSPV